MADTAKESIIKVLDFGSYTTTGLFMELQSRGVSIGVHSVTNRLQELFNEGKVEGVRVEGVKEKVWHLKRYDKKQGIML